MKPLLAIAALALALAAPLGVHAQNQRAGETNDAGKPAAGTATAPQQKPAGQPQQAVPGPTPQETSHATDSNQPLDRAPQTGPQAGSSSSPASNPAAGDDEKKR